jgi:AcrR family transcriptional regulator
MAEDRRAQILKVTFELIGERGLEGLRTRDVAARAKINIATLHYYFATKDDLVTAMVDYTSALFATPPRTRLRASDPQSLEAHLEGAWATFRASPPLGVVFQELSLHGQRHEPMRLAFRAIHRRWCAIVELAVRHDVERGVLRADLDPTKTARLVMSFIMGAITQLGVDPKAFSYERVSAELVRSLSA